MLNVLKNALIYTGIYFIITTIVFWTIFFVHVAILVFWKPFIAVFAILVLVFTFDYLKARNTFTSADAMFAKIKAAATA
ncbi:unnamed protein product [marine sediment metagenome]|uniref:Uncharacterized protein n=1 Tax=marine sediment metagenome TaxID=412755 RepID=X0TD46_9ZZZZ